MGQRLRAWSRWIIRPWRSAGLITALIASFALPAFMAASADVFLVSASDSITRQILDDNLTGLDLSLVAAGQLSPNGVDVLDDVIRSQFDRVTGLGTPRRIVYTDTGLDRPAPDGESPAQPIIGAAARLIASDGALAALEIVEGDRSVEGVWISKRVSDRLDLTVGTVVSVDDSAPFPIAGVFADLWEGDRDPYWDELPPAFVPRFSSVLSGPLFETMFVPESLFLDLGVDGLARWDATLDDRPQTYKALSIHSSQTRSIERSYTQSPEMVDALAGFAGPGAPSPTLTTNVNDLRDEIDGVVSELDQPINTAAIGGIILGLLVTAAGATLAVRKRQSEVRLLRADGDAAWRFAARAIVQFATPATIGALLGVGAAWFLIGVPGGGTRPDAGVIDVGSIVLVAAGGLLVAAAITGRAASRVLHTRNAATGPIRVAWFLPIVGVAAAAWIQVGAAGDAAEVDLLVIAFPLVGLIAGVGTVVLAVRWVMRRLHRTGGSLPPAMFLAWRRITSADSSAVLLSAAMGVALGLIMFSSSLVAGLDTGSVAKATTAIGGATQASVDDRLLTELPADTTVVRVLSTRSTIAGAPVTVLAIDTASYAAGVSWHPTFGSSAEQVVAALEQPTDGGVAAVVAGQFGVTGRAGFGTSSVTPYTVVDSIAAAPLASRVAPTLLVSAAQVDALARRNHETQRPPSVDPAEWEGEFSSPLQRSRTLLISQLDATTLTDFLDRSEVPVQELVTLDDQRALVENQAARWTFEYISLLAVVAGLAALCALFFSLSEQRANRQLSTVMAKQMGLPGRTAAVAAVGEVLGLVAVSFVSGTSVGIVVATRVFDRFEPDPRLPPDVGLDAPWAFVGAVAAAATLVVVLVALVNQWLGNRQTYAEVLRGN